MEKRPKKPLRTPTIREVCLQIEMTLRLPESYRPQVIRIVRSYGPIQALHFAAEAMREMFRPDNAEEGPGVLFFRLVESKGYPLPPLSEKERHVKQVAEEIAQRLGERYREVKLQIEGMIRHLGEERVLELVNQALEVEEQGGLLRPDGQRRPPGGTFFFLAKQAVPEVDRTKVFWHALYAWRRQEHKLRVASRLLEEAKKPPKEPKEPKRKKQKTTLPRPAWGDRYYWVETNRRGEVTVKLTLTGRPEYVEQREGYVIVGLQQKEQIPPLPKALPVPSLAEFAPLRYNIYILSAHWEPVAQALQKDEKDIFIIETLWTMYDQEQHVQIVYASTVTTSGLRAAKRQIAPSVRADRKR